MDLVHRPPAERRAPATLESQTKALEDLRFIRRCVEEAGSFTAVPGSGMVLIGVSALVLAVATPSLRGLPWSLLWMGEAVVALAIGLTFLLRKSRRGGVALKRGPARRFGLSLVPPLVSGALITWALLAIGAYDVLPGVWLLLYGTGVATAGAFSVRAVLGMGISFIVLGGVAVLWPALPPNVPMGVGFGGLHMMFGLLVRRWHGG
jgi:hypothetical protein